MSAISRNASGRARARPRLRFVWVIEMSRLEMRERERRANTVVLCGVVGLVMALAVATIMVYLRSSADHPQTARTPNDRAQLPTETTTERPHE